MVLSLWLVTQRGQAAGCCPPRRMPKSLQGVQTVPSMTSLKRWAQMDAECLIASQKDLLSAAQTRLSVDWLDSSWPERLCLKEGQKAFKGYCKSGFRLQSICFFCVSSVIQLWRCLIGIIDIQNVNIFLILISCRLRRSLFFCKAEGLQSLCSVQMCSSPCAAQLRSSECSGCFYLHFYLL